jgi:hypothetical protein
LAGLVLDADPRTALRVSVLPDAHASTPTLGDHGRETLKIIGGARPSVTKRRFH